MKLLFFLAAFILISFRAYVLYDNHTNHKDDNKGTISIQIGDFKEQIKWSGKIELSEDEKTIKHIQPGGYLKFKENDIRMSAESNIQGDISYSLFDGEQTLPLNDSGIRFVSACLREMINWGYNSNGRAQKIYTRGGYRALIDELPLLKMENIKGPYLELLFKSDSLQKKELVTVVLQTAKGMSDVDKENFLRQIPADQMKDSTISNAWLEIVASVNADIQKVNLLTFFIDRDSLDAPAFNRIMGISEHLNGEIDKQTIYRKLAERTALSEDQYIRLIEAAGMQHADIDKSNLLLFIAQKMPRTEKTKSAYLAAAKKINNDADYGRTVKIIN